MLHDLVLSKFRRPSACGPRVSHNPHCVSRSESANMLSQVAMTLSVLVVTLQTGCAPRLMRMHVVTSLSWYLYAACVPHCCKVLPVFVYRK